jgi:hypothetical protein
MSIEWINFLIFLAILAGIAALATTVPAFKPYLRKRPVVAFLLGISSGFPLTLLLATMTFWLTKVGIDKKTIGFAVGLTTPYTLKFLSASGAHGCSSCKHCSSSRSGNWAQATRRVRSALSRSGRSSLHSFRRRRTS